MFILDGKPLALDRAFTHNDIQYPANWLRLATPEERQAIGIEEVPDPPVWDQRFAWGYTEDGELIWKDHTELLDLWSAQVRTTAGALIAPTDWMVVREIDNGVPVADEVKTERQRIRTLSDEKVLDLEATTTSEELAALVTSAQFNHWGAEPLPEPEPEVLPDPFAPEPEVEEPPAE
jgi:hypothetical protein